MKWFWRSEDHDIAGSSVRLENASEKDGVSVKDGVQGLKPFFAGLLTRVVVATVACFFYGIVKDLGEGMGPQVLTDEALRDRMEVFFNAPLPPTAGRLYYREEGFMDASYRLGLSLPPADAWNLIRAYSGKEKTDFRVPDLQTLLYETGETPLWRPAEMKAPVCHEVVVENESRTLILYDEASLRLLVHFTTF